MLSDGTELAQTRGGTPGRPQIPSLLEHFKACEMAIQVALTNYMITFFGLPIAALTLGEKLAPLAIVGGIFVLGSTLLITIWDKPSETPIEVPVTSDGEKLDVK